jgi:hypothetical protein
MSADALLTRARAKREMAREVRIASAMMSNADDRRMMAEHAAQLEADAVELEAEAGRLQAEGH